MSLARGGSEWLEVKRLKGDPSAPAWRVESRLNGSHYKLGDVFPSREAAQGGALLLAMRLLPLRREVLRAALGAVAGAWWWRIMPFEDATGERSVFSSGVAESKASAERSGRAAGAGWRLFVYGPGGSVEECGLVAR
jgi:hypothetical protein